MFRDGEPVGIQSISARNFPITREATTGSWLGRAFQGRDIGKRMLGPTNSVQNSPSTAVDAVRELLGIHTVKPTPSDKS
ncbi:hypothetical protein GCM10027059_05030 [Myceligenerans halotolerans]